ncbi:MAG: 2-C-methyl-D-erythritol 4-phosphate cytidylyltransferase [Acetatifactor sp.]|nr:2-C-methyl-D-erythritol 4-phosphate cytidylyltransferase [Acetatifactor sp.]
MNDTSIKKIAIVLCAGRGNRMKSDIPKQFMLLETKPVVCYSLEVFENSKDIDDIIIVTGKEFLKYVKTDIVEKYGYSKVRAITEGGSERTFSVYNGIKAIEEQRKSHDEKVIVFIHDGARPFVNEKIIEDTLKDAIKYGASVSAVRSKDTIKVADENGMVASTPDRNTLWNIHTPQVFDFDIIYDAYSKLMESPRPVSDDAGVLEEFSDVKVKLTEGSYDNIKLTTPEDFSVALNIIKKTK